MPALNLVPLALSIPRRDKMNVPGLTRQGLKPEDLIRIFGDIDAPSGRGLTAVGALVIRSEGVSAVPSTFANELFGSICN